VVTIHKEWIRETLYGFVELQILASLALLAILAGILGTVRLIRANTKRRHSQEFAEITEILVSVVSILVVAYLLAEIWAFSVIFERAFSEIFVDRWTGIRQVVTVAIVLSAYLLARAVNRSIDRLLQKGAITRHQKEVAYHVADVGILAIAGLVVLSIWGIDLTNLVIGASALSAVLGLAARKTVAAMIAGFMLLFARPFRVGEWIQITTKSGDEESGIVQDITLFHTKIRTFNDEHMLVPNDEVTSNQLTNFTQSDRLRLDVEVGVDYDTDITHAQDVTTETLAEIELVADSPEPKTVAKQFGDSSVVLELQFWINQPDRRRAWRAQTAAIDAIKQAFEKEEIRIPFPQRTHRPRDEDGFRLAYSAGRQIPEEAEHD